MFLRIDKLGVELAASTKYDPTAAAAVQELLGGRFGEMSTLNNYLHQSTAMRAKKQLGPFYERFWDYDQSLEVPFFISAVVLGALQPAIAEKPKDCPSAFGALRARICTAAAKVYACPRTVCYFS